VQNEAFNSSTFSFHYDFFGTTVTWFQSRADVSRILDLSMRVVKATGHVYLLLSLFFGPQYYEIYKPSSGRQYLHYFSFT